MKKLLRLMLLTCLAAVCYHQAGAQEKKWITGSVKDPTGNPVASATIIEKGTTNQTLSEANGSFRLEVGPRATLTVSSVGFTTADIAVGSSTALDVILQTAAAGLDEVVVTALGIKRQKKSLGYATQEIKSTTLVNAREPNLTNALSGVVAGLQVVRSSNGPAGSSKIVLRGNTSLTGSNQPLIVVDGVPINNFTGATNNVTGLTNNDYWNPEMDMGNGLGDLNAEDIESISVLKGPSAAALYGSRAGNGVILVTTKSGRKQQGIGISVSSTLGVESIFANPDKQTIFGQGNNDTYDPNGGESWGPKIEGQTVTNWRNQSEQLRAYDNIKSFFGNGISNNQSVTFQQQYKNTSVYTSLNYFNDKSIIPGSKLTRTNLMARAVSKFGKDDRWTSDTKIQYSNTDARNRPMGGSNANNYSAFLYNMPVTMNLNDFKTPTDELGRMIWYDGTSTTNPWWATRYNLNQDVRNRFIMSGSLKYNFTSWLDAEVKAGGDFYSTNSESKLYAGSPIKMEGTYGLGKQTFQELNYSTLITAKKDNLFGKLGGSVTIGGNLMRQKSTNLKNWVGKMQVPNLFKLTNANGLVTITDEISERAINSAYGTIGLSWDNFLYIDATFRNDWSSTLHPDNRSYFYPSVSLSYVFTEMLPQLPSWVSYGKLRASYATVGNDLPPYQLYNVYKTEQDPNTNTVASRNKILYDPTVRSELIKSWEFGAEMRFLQNRIGFDFSYYKSNATRQLIDLPMDPGSGYEKRKINAGDIQNKGIELMVDARILNNPNSFTWTIAANFSSNRNEVIDIYSKDSVFRYPLANFDDMSVLAVKDGLYGDIYGSKFLRVEDRNDPNYGQLILSAAGLPRRGETNVRLGNQQAKALLGITNTFGYKGFTLAFLIDARFGGEMFSTTQALMQANGTADVTVVNGGREKFAVDGVIANGSGGYAKNTVLVTPQQYYQSLFAEARNIGITEANIYDATNVRIRNIQLSYDLPGKLLKRTPIQRAKVGVSCNNVWLMTSHMRGMDPESVFATGTNAVGFENSSPPTTRTILFNLSLGF